jgi:hypothetical protein
MELSNKRARLRHELQEAFSAWMLASEGDGQSVAPGAPVDVSGCSESAKTEWFEYLAAKARLTSAYAEQRSAAEQRAAS